MVKIVIKAKSFTELIEMIGEYFHYNRGVNLVGGPFECQIEGELFFCQKITILVR
jgi:hypothetical protein